jgi:hypothetical protein
MKVKVSEAKNLVLDYLVAECEGIEVRQVEGVLVDPLGLQFSPSIDWSYGGMVIEREKITLDVWGDEWLATRIEDPAISEAIAPTPLVAAMRCYVVSQLGDEVEVPDELKGGEL